MAKPKIAQRIDGRLASEASTRSTRSLTRAESDTRSATTAPCDRWRCRDATFKPCRRDQHERLKPSALADERRRWERDLHDGVQNELVALILELALAQEDAVTPPAVVVMLAGLEARAQTALDSVRDIARGIYPPLLADFGLEKALQAQASRAAVDVRVEGTAPRSTDEAEAAVYFACSEAIQNAAKCAGGGTRVTLRLRPDHGSLTVRIADDGRGFDPAHTPEGAGLQNIRDRIEALGGTFRIASGPGHGTILTIWLPWPTSADGRR